MRHWILRAFVIVLVSEPTLAVEVKINDPNRPEDDPGRAAQCRTEDSEGFLSVLEHGQRSAAERRDLSQLYRPHAAAAPASGLPGPEAYRRDLPNSEIHLLDTGHFALETHAAEIGALMCDFLARHGI